MNDPIYKSQKPYSNDINDEIKFQDSIQRNENELRKGGEGSGKKGHITTVHSGDVPGAFGHITTIQHHSGLDKYRVTHHSPTGREKVHIVTPNHESTGNMHPMIQAHVNSAISSHQASKFGKK